MNTAKIGKPLKFATGRQRQLVNKIESMIEKTKELEVDQHTKLLQSHEAVSIHEGNYRYAEGLLEAFEQVLEWINELEN